MHLDKRLVKEWNLYDGRYTYLFVTACNALAGVLRCDSIRCDTIQHFHGEMWRVKSDINLFNFLSIGISVRLVAHCVHSENLKKYKPI